MQLPLITIRGAVQQWCLAYRCNCKRSRPPPPHIIVGGTKWELGTIATTPPNRAPAVDYSSGTLQNGICKRRQPRTRAAMRKHAAAALSRTLVACGGRDGVTNHSLTPAKVTAAATVLFSESGLLLRALNGFSARTWRAEINNAGLLCCAFGERACADVAVFARQTSRLL